MKGLGWGEKRVMAENVRADRVEGLGRRWVIIDRPRRLKVHRWILRQHREHAGVPLTINAAMSRLLADAIDSIEE